MHFSSTKIIDKKPYPGCVQVLVTCIQVLASKLSTTAKFKLSDFQASYLFSSTFKGLEVFILNSSFSRISQARYEPC